MAGLLDRNAIYETWCPRALEPANQNPAGGAERRAQCLANRQAKPAAEKVPPTEIGHRQSEQPLDKEPTPDLAFFAGQACLGFAKFPSLSRAEVQVTGLHGLVQNLPAPFGANHYEREAGILAVGFLVPRIPATDVGQLARTIRPESGGPWTVCLEETPALAVGHLRSG